MKVDVRCLTKEQWSIYSENAHKIVFKEHKPVHFDRIDYALVSEIEGEPVAYITVRETDHETVYWQFGGAFPSGRGTIRVWHCFKACLEWTAKKYKRVTMLIENNNIAMLKLAMSAGLRISGVRYFKGNILLEHGIEFHANVVE